MKLPTSNSPKAEKQHRKTSWLRRGLRTCGLLVLLYFCILVVGLIPINNDFQSADEGVTIFISSNAVHSDIIVPATHKVFDWRKEFPATDFGANIKRCTHVAVGWGDRGFFLETPEWKDLRIPTAANAILWPSSTVMHVQFTSPVESESCRSVTISEEAYQQLVDYILKSFASESAQRKRIDFAYNRLDAFYDARGNYHLFNTCNCWVGGGLKTSGIRAPWFSPLPRTVLWYLPKSNH